MKNKWIILTAVVCCASSIFALTDKEHIKTALKEFTYTDVKEIALAQKRVVNQFAVENGYVDIAPVGGGGGVFAVFLGDGANKANQTESGDLNAAYGGAGGFMVNLNKRWAIGGLFGGFGGTASSKIGNTYHEFGVNGAFQQVVIKNRALIRPKWMIDIDLGLGLLEGSYSNVITDEFSTSLNRSRSGVGLSGMVGVDFRYRISPLFHAGLKAGYFYGKLDNPTRGGSSLGSVNMDMSAPFVMIGLGGNF